MSVRAISGDSSAAIMVLRNQGSQFDAVISDYEMPPGPNGCAVLSEAHGAGVPAKVLFTGRTLGELEKHDQAFARAVCSAMFSKPLDDNNCNRLLAVCGLVQNNPNRKEECPT